MTFTTRSIHSTASPIVYTEFYNALIRALHRAGRRVSHPTKKLTLGVTPLPVREPDTEG